jgi:hypothetical protein
MHPQADCPRCGALLTRYGNGCSVCGYGRDDRDLSARSTVQPGSQVFVDFHELKHTPAIVRSIHDRKEGIISVRILSEDMPDSHAYVIDPADGMIALVIQGEEWELKRRT